MLVYRHNLRNHYEGKVYECHCGSVHKCKDKLIIHERSHNREYKTCEACQKQFASMGSLSTHWKSKHLQTHGPLQVEKSKFIWFWSWSAEETLIGFKQFACWTRMALSFATNVDRNVQIAILSSRTLVTIEMKKVVDTVTYVHGLLITNGI